MAKYTENYNLEKPDKTEYYDIETANKNNDILDARLFEKQDKQAGKGLSTNDFTDEYKKKIDALQKIYKYCGSVETVANLDTIEERQIGDVYNVKDTNIDYCWNGTEWTELGNAVDLTNYQTKEQANQDKQKIEDKLVVVSATEPTGDNREKVWMQKGKNIFDGQLESGNINSSGNNYDDTTMVRSKNFINVEPNQDYIISNNGIAANINVVQYDRNYMFISKANVNAIKITTSATTKYIRFIYSVQSEYKIQIEQGSTATAYEAYVEPKIYVKNDNDIYEEFTQPDVAISAVKPCNNEKVWIQKGKNLARELVLGDVADCQVDKVPYIVDLTTKATIRNLFVTVTAGSSITTSIASGYQYALYICDEKQKVIHAPSGYSSSVETITLPRNAKYVFVRIKNNEGTELSEADLVNIKFQIEYGTEATEYEEYIEEKIYVKNNNGAYEEFINKDNLVNYSKGEQKIGTWIDGKPLYKKTISITVPTVNANGTSNFNAVLIGSNIETIFLAEGFFKDNTNKNVFPLFYTDGAFEYGIRTYIGVKENAVLQVSNSNTSYNGLLGYVTVKYTKTTD